MIDITAKAMEPAHNLVEYISITGIREEFIDNVWRFPFKASSTIQVGDISFLLEINPPDILSTDSDLFEILLTKEFQKFKEQYHIDSLHPQIRAMLIWLWIQQQRVVKQQYIIKRSKGRPPSIVNNIRILIIVPEIKGSDITSMKSRPYFWTANLLNLLTVPSPIKNVIGSGLRNQILYDLNTRTKTEQGKNSDERVGEGTVRRQWYRINKQINNFGKIQVKQLTYENVIEVLDM